MNPPPIIACSTELLLLPQSSSLESTSGRRRGSNKCLYARKGTFWKWGEWGGGGGQFCLGRWKRNEGEWKKRPNEIGQQRLLHHPRLWVRLEESCFFPPSPCVCVMATRSFPLLFSRTIHATTIVLGAHSLFQEAQSSPPSTGNDHSWWKLVRSIVRAGWLEPLLRRSRTL